MKGNSMLDANNRPKTKILLDGGDPAETQRIKELIGFVDGQTTNPSLVAKNPEIQSLLAAGHKLSVSEQNEEYKKIVQSISPLVGDGGVSIEVFADTGTSGETMFEQGKEMYSWISNAYIKYPCTKEGLRAAQMSVQEGMRVNITLVFSQQQAAAVYAATAGAKPGSVYISPFVGRLDDRGENGMDLVVNIKKMYEAGDGHVHVLTASIRSVEHLLATFSADSELATVPAKILEQWAAAGFQMPGADYAYNAGNLKAIPYEQLPLDADWQSYNLQHDLTDAGIKKFVEDYRSTIQI